MNNGSKKLYSLLGVLYYTLLGYNLMLLHQIVQYHGNLDKTKKKDVIKINYDLIFRIFLPTLKLGDVQGDPKRYVPMKISIVALIKKLFISNYNHTLFSLWKTIHQSFSYFCQFLVNLWLSQDLFQMSTISLQANLYSSDKVVNHFYTLLFRDDCYFFLWQQFSVL